MIQQWFLFSLFICISLASNKTGTYGGSIELECEHDITDHNRLAWYYRDKYNSGSKEYAADVRSSSPPTGDGDFANRSYVDFATGYMNISDLRGCHDDQTYTCEVYNSIGLREEFLTHTVVIEPEPPVLTLTFLDNLATIIYQANEDCENNPDSYSADDVEVRVHTSLSILSKPGCDIELVAEGDPVKGECVDGNCEDEKTCGLDNDLRVNVGTTIGVDVTYKGELRWQYCVELQRGTRSGSNYTGGRLSIVVLVAAVVVFLQARD